MLALTLITGAVAQAPAPVNDRIIMAVRPPQLLSEYRLFRDAGARHPNARVTPYDLNTALYSDGGDGVTALSREKAEVDRRIAETEERWLLAHEALETAGEAEA